MIFYHNSDSLHGENNEQDPCHHNVGVNLSGESAIG